MICLHSDIVGTYCQQYPDAKLLNEDHCAQYYDCSGENALPGSSTPYVSECPYPQLFNADTLKCDEFSKVDCGKRAEPLSPCDYLRHQCKEGPGCTPCTDLIPGCEGVPDGPNSYPGRLLTKFFIMCRSNKTASIEICSLATGGVFDPIQQKCTTDIDPRAVDVLCTTNPNARIEHPGICSRFYDCRGRGTGKIERECQYPFLYSPMKQQCVDFRRADCGTRYEPKAPCEYLENKCVGQKCPICEVDNPSCVGLPDGKNAFLGRENTPNYIECRNDRTIGLRKCPGGNNFDPMTRRCLQPEKKFVSPNTGDFGNIIDRETRPMVDPTLPPTGPISKLPDPNPPAIPLDPPFGGEIPPVDPRPPIDNMRPPGGSIRPPGGNTRPPTQPVFDPAPIANLADICNGKGERILADPNNCARYYNCSRYAAAIEGLGPNHLECPYPQLFSTDTGNCDDFPIIQCGGRYEPKSPCEYVTTKLNCNGPMCSLPCEERSPSCVGLRDGNNTFVGRELSPFYISCLRERTLAVGICRYGVYDTTLRYCTTELDPYSVEVFCNSRPNKVFPHIANCARYYDCSAKSEDPVFGKYLRECTYPQLFNIETLRCVPRGRANCRWRYEPKDPCEWQQNQYCPDPNGCVPCAVRFNGCRQKADGNHAVPNNNFEYLLCVNGQVENIGSCRPNTFDPINGVCSTPAFDCTGLSNGRNPMPENDMGYIICKDGRYMGKESCAPDFYDPTAKICRPGVVSANCDGYSDGLYPMRGSKTDFYRCQQGIAVESRSCAPQEFDPITQSCTSAAPIIPPRPRDLGRCVNKKTGWYPLENSATDYIICVNNKEIAVDTCSPHIFDFVSRRCLLFPCRGLGDGSFEVDGTTTFFIDCRNMELVNVASCSPGIYDRTLRRCTADSAPEVELKYPSDPVQFCSTNPSAIMADPKNCAKYIDCNRRDSTLKKPFKHECSYPDLFDSYNASCKSYRIVKCGLRPEPKAPCDYETINRCTDPANNCPPCELEHPSCIGKRDGPQAIPDKPQFFVHCKDERTKSLAECPPTAPMFDPVSGTCSVGLDPLNPMPYCEANPTSVIPHPNNCAQYIDCRQRNTPLGNYKQECPYPMLVSPTDTTGTPCQSFEAVQCGSRPEPMSPCDYEQNQQCFDPANCVPCEQRYPACLGKPDGNYEFPGKPNKYIVCYKDRTIREETCDRGVFDLTTGQCRVEISFDINNPDAYCAEFPTAMLPDPTHCAHYYDCSRPESPYSRYKHECEYPKLYSIERKSCRPFPTVKCLERFEAMDACDYLQNQCRYKPNSVNCLPCNDRIPSCKNLPDGNNTFPGIDREKYYITCFRSRTLYVRTCDRGVFDPVTRNCVFAELDIKNPELYCTANRGKVIPHPENCAQYFDCSKPVGRYGPYLFECKYPELFSTMTGKCGRYSEVKCGGRFEPQDPCDYMGNQCAAQPGTDCEPCRLRLPSCVGKPNGRNTFPGRELTENFIRCFDNRTVSIELCRNGYFDPSRGECRTDIGAATIRAFCMANPDVIKENPVNCAQYFDCGKESIRARTFLRECPYPMMFSLDTSTCQNFTSVVCGNRKEYSAPCDYLQNRCNPRDSSCVPCLERLPSCVGKPDGRNSIPGEYISSSYMICYRGRTISKESCGKDRFDPTTKRCIGDVSEGMIRPYCAANPNSILAHPYNCAQYYDCRKAIGGSHLRECKYPQLFQESSQTCRNFTMVNCGEKFEPQAPCDYLQNHCGPKSTDCTPCEDRLPSCIGLPDDNNRFPGRPVSEYYIKCFRNRTVSVEACQVSKYDRTTRECSSRIDTDVLKKYCRDNPEVLIPDPNNCARYYNCSDPNVVQGLDQPYLKECTYPKLFQSASVGCQLFMMVSCKGRYTPMTPCEYVENQCFNSSCEPCESKYPNCIGQEDGSNVFPGREGSEFYVVCYKQRTVAIVSCTVGVYSHTDRACVGEMQVTPASANTPA
ncbi:hypothetical protein FSP39_010723 [Pinctada imbricata]|uniref:Chitin-binding type-2 domain-containing protein n=1 Tax=Pinctada imbricata TaxID=66713 RepID=A0AA88Y9Y9_PINIB|nr:hypothetical protein FSP39_010723 [Pinctada imbricata]